MRMKSTREITTWKHAQSVDVASLVLEFNTWWVPHLMFCMWNKVDFHAPQTSAILILHNIASYFSRQQKIPRTPQHYCTRPGRQSHFIALSGVWRKWNAARPNTNGHSIGFSAPKPRENSETEGIMCQFARKKVDSIFFHRCRSEKISKKQHDLTWSPSQAKANFRVPAINCFPLRSFFKHHMVQNVPSTSKNRVLKFQGLVTSACWWDSETEQLVDTSRLHLIQRCSTLPASRCKLSRKLEAVSVSKFSGVSIPKE